MNVSILPLFRSTYSYHRSLLTLDEPGKAKPGNPVSVFDLAAQAKLTHVHLVDSSIDGALAAYKGAAKAKVELCYGLKLCVCADMADKSPESRRSESKVVVLVKAGKPAYQDLVRIWNRAWGKEGHFTIRLGGNDLAYGRADWKLLSSLWTERLDLALPFFSSFIARNTMTFNQVTPSLPPGVVPWVLREVDSGLPFAPLIDSALDRYVAQDPALAARVVPSKTVCYEKASDLRAYITFRAMERRGTFDKPNVEHLGSDRFSWEAWKALMAGGPA